MIQINGLTLTHRKDLRDTLENFNRVLNDGDKEVIIGEEGNGKSTLMKLGNKYGDCDKNGICL